MAANQADVGVPEFNSRQKIRHQNENGDDDRHRHFHQLDEIVIRLLVRGIIVARRSGVFNFAVIGHFTPPQFVQRDRIRISATLANGFKNFETRRTYTFSASIRFRNPITNSPQQAAESGRLLPADLA
jgi:hypothetical protein